MRKPSRIAAFYVALITFLALFGSCNSANPDNDSLFIEYETEELIKYSPKDDSVNLHPEFSMLKYNGNKSYKLRLRVNTGDEVPDSIRLFDVLLNKYSNYSYISEELSRTEFLKFTLCLKNSRNVGYEKYITKKSEELSWELLSLTRSF